MTREAGSAILLVGANGQLGRQLTYSLDRLGQVVRCVRPEYGQPLDNKIKFADLSDPDQIRRIVREVRPNLIVNAAAYTAVDAAEQDPEAAFAINAVAPGILAEEAAVVDAVLIHYSTDYVFSGIGESPWSEEDAPDPINVYGKTKLLGEEAIRAAGASHLILRTSWLYGASGQNFVTKMLALCTTDKVLKIVGDQIGAPTSTRFLAEVTASVVARYEGRAASLSMERGGVVHVACAGETSWFEFAKEIFLQAAEFGLLQPKIERVAASAYPSIAPRPLNSRFNTSKLSDRYGVAIPGWRQELRANLSEICLMHPELAGIKCQTAIPAARQ